MCRMVSTALFSCLWMVLGGGTKLGYVGEASESVGLVEGGANGGSGLGGGNSFDGGVEVIECLIPRGVVPTCGADDEPKVFVGRADVYIFPARCDFSD